MSERFVITWAICWIVIGICCFIFGFNAIPRMTGYSHTAAFFEGVTFGLITIGPFVWFVIFDKTEGN